MKKFRVIEHRVATYTWTHYIEAETEEEALDKLENGDIEESYGEVEIDYDVPATIESVEEIENKG
jgi:hypothetical protein